MSQYKAIQSAVVKEIIKYDGPFTYIDGLIFSVTSNITQIDVEHYARFAGRSNYSLLRSIKVWLKLATGFSVIPLRIATFFIIQALVIDKIPEGYPSLIVTVFFLGGIQLMGMGAMGEYIGRIFITQNKTPQFTVKDVVRWGKSENREVGRERSLEAQ
jgi:undecaprenyl-phosphate 4-deoxy-4-formamido-L-arabinose transferase